MSVLRTPSSLAGLLLLVTACAADEAPLDASVEVVDAVAEADATPAEVDVAADAIDATEMREDVEVATEVEPVGCRSFDLTGSLEAKDAPGTFQLGGQLDLGLGGPFPDAVIFEFYSDETGTFDLAADGNDNYKTCTQCLRFVVDIDPTGVVPAKNFFQKSGTLTIDPSTPPNGAELEVTLTDLEMIEVTIRAADFQTTPVADGACYSRAEPLVLATGACRPACGEHVCGPDGCGGECGAGCSGAERCHLDGSKCEVASTCVPLALAGPLAIVDVGVYRLDVTGFGLGAVGQDDFVQIEFYKDTVGAVDLHSTSNRNYATCNQCVRLIVDGRTELFQRSGELLISEASVPMGDPETDGYIDLMMTGVVLEEVFIDEEFNSMSAPNGACVEIIDGRLGSAP